MEKLFSQMHNPFLPSLNESISRMEAMSAEMAKLEAEGLKRSLEAMTEATKLWRESMEYQTKLAGEWRKTAIDTMKKSVEATKGEAKA